MKAIRTVSLLALVFVTGACTQNTGPDTEPGASAQELGEQAADDTGDDAADGSDDAKKDGKRGKHHRRGHHGKHFGGPVGMFLHAARGLELSDEQQTTVKNIAEGLRPDPKQFRESRVALDTALAAGVESGSIDDAALSDARSKAVAAAARRADEQAKALNALHAALTPEQRTQLATEIRDRAPGKDMKRHGKHMGKRRGPPPAMDDAPAVGDATSNDSAPKQLRRGMRGGPGGMHGAHARGFGGPMLSGIELDQAQVAQLRDTKPEQPSREDMKAKRAEMKQKLDELLTAFESDSFDATTFDFASGARKHAERHFDGHVARIRGLLGVLTPDQRATLAENLRKGPPERPMKRFGGKRSR